MTNQRNDVQALRVNWATPRVAKLGHLLNPPRLLVEAGTILAFVAAILATNYTLVGFPNVKLFDLMVFVAGYTLGFRRGAIVAASAWLLYGSFNPHGPASLPLLAILMASETVYAAAGASIRNIMGPSRVQALPSRISLLFGGTAIICTFIYDGLTNIYTGIIWAQMSQSTDYFRWTLTALFSPGALFFAAGHTASNFLFFTVLAPILIKGVRKVRGN